jgi:ABC-2 type transport system ATP-binding protein
MNYSIEVKNFTKRFQSKVVVNNASFVVKKGTIHGFIGPNGAGKSTTLKSLMGLVNKSSGSLEIEGKKVIENPFFNQNVGWIPAEPNFDKSWKVESFIEWCGKDLKGISMAEIKRKLTNSPLNQYRSKPCRSLSTGWKKILLVFIAMSLFPHPDQPKILILDEVRNGLDPTAWFQLEEKLKEFRNQGGSVLLSTHILSDIQVLADEITMIDQGKIVHTGPKPPNVEELYKKLFFQSTDSEKRKTTTYF